MNDFSQYPRFNEFLNKKILAIDFGTKVIGTSLFSPGKDPFPYMSEKIIYQSHDSSILKIKKLIDEEAVDIVVMGVPFFVDGKESTNTLFIRAFGEQLKSQLTGIAFYEQDETLTTQAAMDRMKSSPQFNFKVDVTMIDCVSATIILEDFIRSNS